MSINNKIEQFSLGLMCFGCVSVYEHMSVCVFVCMFIKGQKISIAETWVCYEQSWEIAVHV